MFECKLSENTNLPQNASLVKDVIENVLADKEIVARFVIYNGIDKIEIVNGKEVIYTSNYEKLAALNTDLFKSEVREGRGKMNFVDWNWQQYGTLRLNPELKQQQERLLWGTGLCEGEEGLEYSFVPTKNMEQLEIQLFNLYPKIRIIDKVAALCNEIFSTSKIEGAKTTLLRTQQIHDGAEIDDSNYFSESMILGGFRATKYLNDTDNEVTIDSLFEVWKLLTKGACDNGSIKGERFRTGHVVVGNHAGLNPELIEEAMQNWVDYYNGDTLSEHPFIKAALLHFAFEFIHPFCDGNGRAGRLLMNNFLIKEGMEKIKAVSFSRSIEKDRLAYDYALSRGDNPQTDCTYFIEYMLNVFVDAFLDVC